MTSSEIQTVILCGGKGTRLRELTEAMPKVLVEIGGRPILWHIMRGYEHFGFTEFLLALGYLGDRVAQYFSDNANGGGREGPMPRVAPKATLIDTGLETNTGGRIKRLEGVIQGETFFATYGDGLSDVDLRQLLAFHRAHGRIATVTVAMPRLNFGLVELDAEDHVTRFQEKPRVDGWINGGFFVFNREIFRYLDDNSVLEQEPMSRLAADRQLVAYRHTGFWACMDTYKDQSELNAQWAAGDPPWRLWSTN